MVESNGSNYFTAKYAKALLCAEAKVGKSAFVIGSALGVLPWQKAGGIVTEPQDLHVLAFDANALGGIKRFLLETCKAPEAALNFTVYNFQDDVRKAAFDGGVYALYNSVAAALNRAGERITKRNAVGAVHVSSLSGLAEGLLTAMSGVPDGKRGGGMDRDKWGEYARLLTTLRNQTQADNWHSLWEAHVFKETTDNTTKQTLSIAGKTAQNFAINVEQVFQIRRQFGAKYASKDGTVKSACDLVHLDTQPAFDFIAGGRNFTESLEAKEYDMTAAFEKLGLRVGKWGMK